MGMPDICRVFSTANTSQSLGSDSSLRQIFAEIGTAAEGSFSREELSNFILYTLTGVGESTRDLVVALLCQPETAEERWEEFTFLCRMGLQWQSTLSSIVAKNGDQKAQVEGVKRTITMAPADTMKVGRLMRLLRRAHLRIGKEQVAKLIHASSKVRIGSIEKSELETLLEALCALARIAQLRDPEADEVAQQSLHLVHELAGSVFRTSTSKRKKTIKPSRDSVSVVTKQDFQRLFESLGVPVEENRLEAVIATFDEDGNGSFEKMECSKLLDVSMKWHNFMRTLARSAKGAGANFSDASLRREFVGIDKDRSGSIDKDELMQCFRHKNIDLDMPTLNKVMVLADSDGSGDIEWPEFRRMFKIIEASLGAR
jgi:Ca2+-binding EF-hand superfamily protein